MIICNYLIDRKFHILKTLNDIKSGYMESILQKKQRILVGKQIYSHLKWFLISELRLSHMVLVNMEE